MEQTDKEPHWFAFVALSGLGRLKAHRGGKLMCVCVCVCVRACVWEIQCITSRRLWGVSIAPDLQVIYQGGWFH